MRHASFFSGVGGLDLGFERAGIETVSVSEIDPYASMVLSERFPGAPNLGDITEIDANDIPEADIWSGGFPCQDLSRAGRRAGFSGRRSSLAFAFLDLVEQRRPRWLVLENVPGLFTSNDGADFGRLLSEMEQLGYGVAWRTLDAQYFGVPQRRSRVFVVGSLASDRSSEVLFECEGCERHPSTSKKAGKESSPAIGERLAGDRWLTDIGLLIGAAVLSDRMREADGMARRMDDTVISFPSRYSNQPTKFNNKTDPLTIGAGAPAVLYDGGRPGETNDPDGLDGHRYRCCGNGVVAPVAEWIGRRIVAVDVVD